jgi:hypothetical protein
MPLRRMQVEKMTGIEIGYMMLGTVLTAGYSVLVWLYAEMWK